MMFLSNSEVSNPIKVKVFICTCFINSMEVLRVPRESY